MNSMIIKIGALALATAGFAAAENYSGQLVAARCTFESDGAKAHSPEGCSPNASTNVFGVRMPDGTVLRFDDAGNRQAAAALREDPRKQTVTVSGSLEGRTLKVDSIETH
jgi:hypothetical protein